MTHRLKFLPALVVSLLLVTAPSLALIKGRASADTFNGNNIINDVVFDNTATMSAANIDAFLNTFPNSCISPNSGFRAIDPNGYSPNTGFSYGGFVTAGQVIYDSAQAYGINPQVLLTTLQKEQSLVAGGGGGYCNSNGNMYAAAVGYGCPDSGSVYSYNNVNLYQRNGVNISSVDGTCVNSATKAGFSQQVIRAAWLLKFGEQRSEGHVTWAVIKGNWDNSDDLETCYGGPMTQGNFQRCPSSSATYYDGYFSIDGSVVHMDDGATAALYWYTPHFSGNQHFFDIFSSWFGSPLVSSSPYAWNLVSQEAYTDAGRTQKFTDGVTLAPGQTAYFRVIARNMGYKTWDNSFVRLAASHPQDRGSVFANNTWLNAGRLHMNEASVVPGNNGTFEFSMTAPQATGSYSEFFNMVADGQTWMNDLGLVYQIDVVTPTQPTNSQMTGLNSGQTITPGQNLLSPDGQVTFNVQADGNLVEYSDFKAAWASSTFDGKVARLSMQPDGNLVEYDTANTPIWATNTYNHPGAHLVLQSDGNLVLYDANNSALWATYALSNPDHLSRVNKILSNARMYTDQPLQTANRAYKLVLQGDGNLVLYSTKRALWSSSTVGSGAIQLAMQSDGNLVLYTRDGRAVWNTGTYRSGQSQLLVQPDGNLVVYNAAGQATWSTRTNGQQ